MKKTVFTCLCRIIAGILLFPSWLSAQTFWSEDFSNGIPSDWAKADASGQEVLWASCSSPADCLPIGPLQDFFAPSAGNGFALLHSSEAGTLPTPHRSRLETAAIDCSGKSQVFLQFQTSIATVNEAGAQTAQLHIIADGETTAFQAFPSLTENEPQRAPLRELSPQRSYAVTLDITEAAAGFADVRIAWEWHANAEQAWLVDDVLLSTAPPAAPENALFYESFSFGPNGWTSRSTLGSDVDSNWVWAPGGNVSNAYSLGLSQAIGSYAFLHSETAADGGMVFNADFYSTGGTAPPPPGPPTFYVCELISPEIDLSATPARVALQLSYLAWLGNTAPAAPETESGARFSLSCAYSTDGGENWSDPIPVNPFLTPITSANLDLFPPFSGSAYLPLPGIQDSESFRIKFTWAADFYFWAIDDVAIVERPVADLRTNRNFFARAPNAITPSSQLTDIPLMADVENIGAEPVEEAWQQFSAQRLPEGATVYEDSLLIESLAPDALFENQVFADYLPAAAVNTKGEYSGRYGLSSVPSDAKRSDNQLEWRFEVSDTLLAKERGFTRDITPFGFKNYAFGNCYYLPAGEGYYARTLSFAVSNADDLAQRTLSILLYEWEGDVNNNQVADQEELQEIAFNGYTFTGEEGLKPITVPVSFENEGVPLRDGRYYLAVVSYINGDIAAAPPMFMMVNDQVDYLATNVAHQLAGLPLQYGAVLNVDPLNSIRFETVGFGYNIVPQVRLSIGTSPILQEQTTNLPRRYLSLAPNPADESVMLRWALPANTAAQTIRLLNLQGKVMRQRTASAQFHRGEQLLETAQLPEGCYIVRLQTNVGWVNRKLLVQH